MREPLPWPNTTLLQGDVATAVAELKQQPGKDLHAMGSGELIQALLAANVIDEFVLLVYPLVLGSGRRLFPDGGAGAALQLVSSVNTTKGVVIARYQPRGEPADT